MTVAHRNPFDELAAANQAKISLFAAARMAVAIIRIRSAAWAFNLIWHRFRIHRPTK
jgi:hypothetical protein